MIDKFLREVRTTLTREAQRDLEAITKIPEVAAIIARDDAEHVTARRQKLGELAAVPVKHSKELESLVKKLGAASARITEQEEALSRARNDHHAIQLRISSIEAVAARDEGAIRRWLEQGADPRIKAFIQHCIHLFDMIGVAGVSFVSLIEKIPFGGGVVNTISSNCQALNQTRDELRQIRREMEQALLAASTRAEITDQLKAWHARMFSAMKSVGLERAVFMINDDGEFTTDPEEVRHVLRDFLEGPPTMTGQERAYTQGG